MYILCLKPVFLQLDMFSGLRVTFVFQFRTSLKTISILEFFPYNSNSGPSNVMEPKDLFLTQILSTSLELLIC